MSDKTLEELKAENDAAWGADTHVSGYDSRCLDSDSVYIPALEAEVNRLRALVDEPPLTADDGDDK